MAKYIFTFSFFMGFAKFNSIGQTLPPIQTDRPDQTECPFITPQQYIQAENGFTYENIDNENKSIAHPSILWKYGLSKTFEFRLITEVVSEKNLNATETGLSPITVGFKVNIAQEKGILPTTSFIGHLTLPYLASKKFKSIYYAPSFRFTMQHSLSKRFSLGYNLGAEWDGETPEPTFIYTLTTGCSMTEKLGGYLELYGFAPQQSKADHRIDGGVTYLITNNAMVDVSGGFGLTDNAPKNYVALGFSYRFNTK